MEYLYDVTLSYASEDRDYVEKVAKKLLEKSIKVYYDQFEQTKGWGKDLGIYFDYIYRKSAKYFIPFISRHYKKSVWTNHELRTAISRAIENYEEYILPARFDNTEIEGIRNTLSFINLKSYSPEEFAEVIVQKLGMAQSVSSAEELRPSYGDIYFGVRALINEREELYRAVFGVNITNTAREYKYFNEPCFTLSNPFEGATDTFSLSEKLVPLTFPLRLEFGDTINIDYHLSIETVAMWEKLPKETFVEAIVTTTAGQRFKSNKVFVSDVLRVMHYIG